MTSPGSTRKHCENRVAHSWREQDRSSPNHKRLHVHMTARLMSTGQVLDCKLLLSTEAVGVGE